MSNTINNKAGAITNAEVGQAAEPAPSRKAANAKAICEALSVTPLRPPTRQFEGDPENTSAIDPTAQILGLAAQFQRDVEQGTNSWLGLALRLAHADPASH